MALASDWPVDYSEMAPYYDASSAKSACAEITIISPICPMASSMPPVPMKCSDAMIQAWRARSSASP